MHVPKEKIQVTMVVDRFRIVGYMHKYPGARMLDLVNIKEASFVPVTDADIFSINDGKLIYHADFVGVNKNEVSFFYPLEDTGTKETG
ncbi:MAG: hypothetical protein KKF41_11150 [Actinobacteria bacterium]|nr:hypothetical protein [Actinomycetota bacterium]MBU1944943.1 hypothetical protein [Actinomycetota bacterium]MBU2688131.1 hypothetical protein [Actinomycetota bacterium]